MSTLDELRKLIQSEEGAEELLRSWAELRSLRLKHSSGDRTENGVNATNSDAKASTPQPSEPAPPPAQPQPQHPVEPPHQGYGHPGPYGQHYPPQQQAPDPYQHPGYGVGGGGGGGYPNGEAPAHPHQPYAGHGPPPGYPYGYGAPVPSSDSYSAGCLGGAQGAPHYAPQFQPVDPNQQPPLYGLGAGPYPYHGRGGVAPCAHPLPGQPPAAAVPPHPAAGYAPQPRGTYSQQQQQAQQHQSQASWASNQPYPAPGPNYAPHTHDFAPAPAPAPAPTPASAPAPAQPISQASMLWKILPSDPSAVKDIDDGQLDKQFRMLCKAISLLPDDTPSQGTRTMALTALKAEVERLKIALFVHKRKGAKEAEAVRNYVVFALDGLPRAAALTEGHDEATLWAQVLDHVEAWIDVFGGEITTL